MKPKFFADQLKFRSWLKKNHEKREELWVGFYKVNSGLPSLTWPESVDQALCFGWIDGLRKSIDDKSYMIRFTPRKPTSTWSAVNIKKVAKLKKDGLMRPAGLKAYQRRDEKNSGIYSFEQKKAAQLSKEYEAEFKKEKKAWAYYRDAAPSYRKQTTWWVMSAKKEETRRRRLGILIDHCEKESKIPQVDWKKKKK